MYYCSLPPAKNYSLLQFQERFEPFHSNNIHTFVFALFAV